MHSSNNALAWVADTDLCLEGVTSCYMEEATDIYWKLCSSYCTTSYKMYLLVNLSEN